MTVDWARRFDHMQQHTSQHLISAHGDRLGLKTLSWALRKDVMTIDLDAPVVTPEQVEALELTYTAHLLLEAPDYDLEEERLWCIEFFTQKMYDYVVTLWPTARSSPRDNLRSAI